MEFNDKNIPASNTNLKEKDSSKNKASPSALFQRLKKKSIVQIEGLEELKQLENETLELIKEQEELSIVEQALKRQKELKEEKENKKRKIKKKMNKPKKIDINQFLTRAIGYEQKKNFNLELRRYKKLEEENKLCTDRPILTPRTYEMFKTLNNRPITEKKKGQTDKKEKRIGDIKNKDDSKLRSEKNKKRLNNSMDNIGKDYKIKKEEYIINDRIKNRKMNGNEMIDYYKRQYEWKNKLEQKNRIKEKRQNNQKIIEINHFFHPQISPGSLEIIIERNKINKKKKNKNFYNLNDEIDVYERLYKENFLLKMKKKENENKALSYFQPFINKNKYKQIRPKYKEDNTHKKWKKRSEIKKHKLKGAKSVEANRKDYEVNKSNIKTNALLKSQKNLDDSEDASYRLNIRQASAWNENDVNIVLCKGGFKEIVKYFI